jgi:Ras-related C3 botulinum toxin substrate 1
MWVPEIQEHCPTTPYILVGLNSDVRDGFAEHADEYRDKGWKPIATSTGLEMKKRINAQAYVECSANDIDSLKEVFETAARVALCPSSPAQGKVKHSGGDGHCDVS